MTVLLFEKRFWKPIVEGDKVHTIRRERKRAIKPGDLLSLRGWEGVAYRSRQRTLSDEICLNATRIWIDIHSVCIDGFNRICEPDDLERFAVSDGFECWAAMRAYNDFFRSLPFSGYFIQWGEHKMLREFANK